jgi:hypothetical protein
MAMVSVEELRVFPVGIRTGKWVDRTSGKLEIIKAPFKFDSFIEDEGRGCVAIVSLTGPLCLLTG